MATATWYGITSAASMDPTYAAHCHALANAARQYAWDTVLSILRDTRDLINATRPDGKSWYTPLHQAAHGGAPLEITQRLIDWGAWRTIPTADGERACDIALKQGHHHLVEVLEPQYLHQVAKPDLAAIQGHLHRLMREESDGLIETHALRLPELSIALEFANPELWCPIPGMYGGFSLRLDSLASEPTLESSSWSRVVEGSGRRYSITKRGATLIEVGFV